MDYKGYVIYRGRKRVGYVVGTSAARALKKFAGTRDHELSGDTRWPKLLIGDSVFDAELGPPSPREWQIIMNALKTPARDLVIDERGLRTT